MSHPKIHFEVDWESAGKSPIYWTLIGTICILSLIGWALCQAF